MTKEVGPRYYKNPLYEHGYVSGMVYTNQANAFFPQHPFIPGYGDVCAECKAPFMYFHHGQAVHYGALQAWNTQKGKQVNYPLATSPMVEEDDIDDQLSYKEQNARQMPFTKLMTLIREARYAHNILDQEEVWVGRDGLKVELTKMSARYAQNILAYLKRNAKFYSNGWATWEFITKYSDHAAEDFEDIIETNNTDASARKWIRQSKLYKALETISKNSV